MLSERPSAEIHMVNYGQLSSFVSSHYRGMAEGQGFEPWDGINRRWFSRPVLSTAQPPLQWLNLNAGGDCDQTSF